VGGFLVNVVTKSLGQRQQRNAVDWGGKKGKKKGIHSTRKKKKPKRGPKTREKGFRRNQLDGYNSRKAIGRSGTQTSNTHPRGKTFEKKKGVSREGGKVVAK